MEEDVEALRLRLRELETKSELLERMVKALGKIEELSEKNLTLEREKRLLQEKVEELYTFWTMSRALSGILDLDELFKLALHLIGRSLKVDQYSLMLLEEDRLVVKAAFGIPEELVRDFILRVGEGISGLVAQRGEPILVQDLSKEPRFLEYQWWTKRTGSFLSVPLLVKKREVIGVLSAHKPELHAFTEEDLEVFSAVAAQIAIAIENAQLYQRTRELSSLDDLTHLFNRRHLFDQLEKEVQRAKRYGRLFSVVILDIDDFKRYNDTYGHLRGDEVLREIARLIKANIRRADIAARYGGEEFVILLPEIPKSGAIIVAEKIRSAIEKHPFPGRETQPGGKLTITLGVSSFPQDAEEGHRLLELADRALYVGKAQGGNRVSPYGTVIERL